MKNSLPDTIVLAGGLGTRLQSVIKNTPKPMANVAGKPFLYWLLNYISNYNPSKIILSTGYLSETIEEFFGNNFNNIPIIYSVEDAPLGTGGAIKKALGYCNSDNCMVINGDTFFKIDFYELLKFHTEQNSDFTISLKELENPVRYGTVELTGFDITRFREKNQELKRGFINAGIYLFKKSISGFLPNEEKFSFEKDFLETSLNKLKFKGMISNGNFIDIGIPEDYKKANDEFYEIFN